MTPYVEGLPAALRLDILAEAEVKGQLACPSLGNLMGESFTQPERQPGKEVSVAQGKLGPIACTPFPSWVLLNLRSPAPEGPQPAPGRPGTSPSRHSRPRWPLAQYFPDSGGSNPRDPARQKRSDLCCQEPVPLANEDQQRKGSCLQRHCPNGPSWAASQEAKAKVQGLQTKFVFTPRRCFHFRGFASGPGRHAGTFKRPRGDRLSGPRGPACTPLSSKFLFAGVLLSRWRRGRRLRLFCFVSKLQNANSLSSFSILSKKHSASIYILVFTCFS